MKRKTQSTVVNKMYTSIVDWNTLRSALDSVQEGLFETGENIVNSVKNIGKKPKNLRKKRK